MLRVQPGQCKARSKCTLAAIAIGQVCHEVSRSIDKVVSFVTGCLVAFSPQTQMTMAWCSAEAELGATHRVAINGVFLSNKLEDITSDSPRTRIFSDSSVGRPIAYRRGCGRVRRLSVLPLFVQRLIKSRRVSLHGVATEDNLADWGTKVLPTGTEHEHTKMGFLDSGRTRLFT